MATLFALPLDLLLLVFSYVPFRQRFKVRIVCQSWNRLLVHPVLLQHLDFSGRSLKKKNVSHGFHACLDRATKVFSLNFSFSGNVRLALAPNVAEKLNALQQLRVGSSFLNKETVIRLVRGTHCLRVLDMQYATLEDDVCEIVSQFASHSLRVLYLPVPIWRPSRLLKLIDACKELVTLGLMGNMIDFDSIEDIFNGSRLKRLRKLRLADVNDAYVIKLARTLKLNQFSVELCVCRVQTLKAETLEEVKSLRIPLCKKCSFDISTFTWVS